MCHFELRACKYRFDIENELLYIFQALIYSTHRFKKVQINRNFDQKGRFEKNVNIRCFQREGSPYLACIDRNAFFTSEKPKKKYHAWSCQNVCDALTFLLDNIFIRFGTKLYRQVVEIPMVTNCAPLVADLFLFCYERDFLMSLSDDKQADVIDAFNTTSRYLDDILNINNVYFDNMVSQIYPSELQLNKANTSDTEAAFLDLHLSISKDIVSTKIYDKRDDFDFEIVNFPFLDGQAMFPVLHPMESIFLNSFVLLEHLALLLTSTLAINCNSETS